MKAQSPVASALYRAKNAYWLWLHNAVPTDGFSMSNTGYKFWDQYTGITVYLKMNGAFAYSKRG